MRRRKLMLALLPLAWVALASAEASFRRDGGALALPRAPSSLPPSLYAQPWPIGVYVRGDADSERPAASCRPRSDAAAGIDWCALGPYRPRPAPHPPVLQWLPDRRW